MIKQLLLVALILGVTYSASITLTNNVTDGSCAGTLVAAGSDVTTSPTYAWSYSTDNGTNYIATSITADTFDVAVSIMANGTFLVKCVIDGTDGTNAAQDEGTQSITLDTCVGTAVITSTITDSTCTGTLVAVGDTASASVTYAWSYSTDGTTYTNISTVTSDTLNATDFGVNGSITAKVVVSGNNADGVAVTDEDTQAVVLAGCALTGTATLTNTVTNGTCTGTIQVTATDAVTTATGYVWKWNDGTSDTTSTVTTDTFNVTEIGADGTYTVSVTVSDGTNTDTATQSVTLGACSSTPADDDDDDDDDDDSSKILGALILVLAALVF